MQLLGLRTGRLLVAWPVLGALAALLPALWMWRFTVDDALIAVRYARHLAAGNGWRFNAHGPSTDGVTPLPWPLLLALFARAEPVVVLERAKVIGLVAWVSAGALLGLAFGRSRATVWARAAALCTIALSVPLAAYAVSGMETALATALATGASLLGSRPRTAGAVAGAAATLRPEMAPWALVLAVALALSYEGMDGGEDTPKHVGRVRRAIEAGALALAPFAACAVIRALVWGRPAPLAVLAKPSDIAHGLAYTGAACVVTLVPLLVVAPFAVARQPVARSLVLAALAHACALIVVGGDWMPYARLMVPVVPSLAYAAVLASECARSAATALRALAAIVLGVVFVARGGTSGRTVGTDRAALIDEARPRLQGAARVAALDVGWVSASTEADIVDLAGLTDPEIASLPGGHTSKRVDAMFLLGRAPDVLLLFAPRGLPGARLDAWQELATPRAVEARLAGDEVIARHFAPDAWLALGVGEAGYVVLRAR